MLLNQYGNLENIYKNIEEISNTEKKNLLNYKEDLEVSKKLVTLVKDVPLSYSLEEFKFEEIDKKNVFFFKLFFFILKKLTFF